MAVESLLLLRSPVIRVACRNGHSHVVPRADPYILDDGDGIPRCPSCGAATFKVRGGVSGTATERPGKAPGRRALGGSSPSASATIEDGRFRKAVERSIRKLRPVLDALAKAGDR